MKRLLSYVWAVVMLLAVQACSTSESEDPVAAAQNNLVRTWRASNIAINNIPLSALGAALPGFDPSGIRITFRADRTFQATNLGALGAALPATGTWAFDNNDPTRIVINPGNLQGTISNLSAATCTLTYQFNTANTPLSVLGPSATIRVDMTPG